MKTTPKANNTLGHLFALTHVHTPQYVCLECGHKFYSVVSAGIAVNSGCPGCGGGDIDVYVPKTVSELREGGAQWT
jgi:hypothetical protein